MQAARILPLGFLSLLLSACQGAGESGYSSGIYTVSSDDHSSGGGNPAPGGFSGAAGGAGGTKDTVVTTTSVPGTVAVTAGASQTVSVTFTSSDGRPIHGLEITGTTLPADWSGTDNYGCTLVGAGSSCVLNLTYAPKAAES